MARLGRKGRILKWAGLIVSLLVATAWGLSMGWDVYYLRWDKRLLARTSVRHRPVFSAALTNGRLGVHRHATWSQGRPDWLVSRAEGPPVWLPSYRRDAAAEGTRFDIWVPLWIPFLFVALPTGVLWYRDRCRRILPGRCQKCGYNLTGNVSGVCPECGTRIQTVEPRKDK